jgi:glutaredoxin
MIKAYTMTNCPMCEELKSYMRNSHIAYEEANVDTDPGARAKMVFNDIEQMPAIEVNGKLYSGDVDELKNIVMM